MSDPQQSHQPHRSRAPDSLTRRISFFTWLLDFPALSVLPFLRHDIGYRVLSPGHYLGIWFVLFFGPTISATLMQIASGSIANATFGVLTLRRIELPSWWLMEVFSVIMVVLAFIKRRISWRAFCDGRGIHTNSLGVSYLASMFSIRPDRVNRIVDPIFCVVLGLLIQGVTGNPLGIWLMISGVALYLFEQRYFDWLLTLQFDRHDLALLPKLQERLMHDIRVSKEKPPSPVVARIHELVAGVGLHMPGYKPPAAELPQPPTVPISDSRP